MAADLKCCGKPLRRLGRVGREDWFQCMKCKDLFTKGVGSKRARRRKDYQNC